VMLYVLYAYVVVSDGKLSRWLRSSLQSAALLHMIAARCR